MLYTAEQLLPTIEVRFPGAWRIRKLVPGTACSNPSGAVYQGSLLGGIGADPPNPIVSRGERATENATKSNKVTCLQKRYIMAMSNG